MAGKRSSGIVVIFLQLLKNLVGEENTETLNLADIEARFSPASAEGKALIIGEDNDRRTYLDKSDNFKSITSGDPIFIEKREITQSTI